MCLGGWRSLSWSGEGRGGLQSSGDQRVEEEREIEERGTPIGGPHLSVAGDEGIRLALGYRAGLGRCEPRGWQAWVVMLGLAGRGCCLWPLGRLG